MLDEEKEDVLSFSSFEIVTIAYAFKSYINIASNMPTVDEEFIATLVGIYDKLDIIRKEAEKNIENENEDEEQDTIELISPVINEKEYTS